VLVVMVVRVGGLNDGRPEERVQFIVSVVVLAERRAVRRAQMAHGRNRTQASRTSSRFTCDLGTPLTPPQDPPNAANCLQTQIRRPVTGKEGVKSVRIRFHKLNSVRRGA
jgi:hypothetical protein